jgi:DNA-directed RNA polymerase subunit omega
MRREAKEGVAGMTQVAIEQLLQRCSSIYKLVILAARRAKELSEGAPPLVDTRYAKVTSVALDEILHGKVLYKPEEPAEGSGKKARGAKAKDEKKKRATA